MSTYEISKSSLLSLKAEILRKEQDLARVKGENEIKAHIKKKTPLEFKNKGVEARSKNDMTEEEQDLLKLSSSRLAEKAAIYDKLTQQTTQTEDVKRRYLVQFDQKNYEIRNEVDAENNGDSDNERHFSDEYDSPDNSDEEWVEYIDCLGRSRKCLRTDLEYLKSKDADLKVIVKKRKETSNPEVKESDKEKDSEIGKGDKEGRKEIDKEQELISGDMKREMLRQQWEQEEAELMNKDDVHYQDILFSEARQHGVGYYSFSKDEEERAKQQEALKRLREDTEQKQRKAQQLKALREKQMAIRMKAARNRKRTRMGLPPEEDDPEESKQPETKEKTPEPTQEEERKTEEEKRLEEARKRHIRPWDVGKDGVQEFYEMTQDEWNEKQRELRIDEFAPPNIYKDNVKNRPSKKVNPYLNNHTEYKKAHPSSSDSSDDSNNEDFVGPPPPPNISDSIEAGLRFFRDMAESSTNNDRSFTSTHIAELPPQEDKSLKFTSKKANKTNLYLSGDNVYRENSDSDIEICSSPKRSKNEDMASDDVIIGPPAPPPNISESFEAGLTFLRNKAEKRRKQCPAPW